MKKLIISIEGKTLSESDRFRLSSPLVVGVILFTRNYQDKRQLTELTSAIKACSSDLFICIDQEGGRVQRLIEGFTRLPKARSFGLQYDKNPKQAIQDLRRSAKTMFTELRSCGIDRSLVPCLDIDWGNSEIIGDRSFSTDPELVCILGQAYVKALKEEGMLVTGKHFPGHGYVSLDSHLTLPVDERSLDDIKKSDIKPYNHLISELDMIMTAHIVFPAVDSLPVTFSKVWLQTILREEMGYKGIIVSDCLTMVGAAKLYPDIVERVNAALSAGCDWMFLCNSDAAVDELIRRKAELIELSPGGV